MNASHDWGMYIIGFGAVVISGGLFGTWAAHMEVDHFATI